MGIVAVLIMRGVVRELGFDIVHNVGHDDLVVVR